MFGRAIARPPFATRIRAATLATTRIRAATLATTRIRAATLATAAAAALAAATAPAAHAAELPAACRANTSKIRQQDRLAPLVVGDSVTVAAGRYLGRRGFTVDAVACRTFLHGLEAMGSRRLPGVVVVALGSNGDVVPEQLERALELVGPFGRLVFVLPKALGGRRDADGRLMRAFANVHPERVDILDWPGYSAGETGWFATDGLHLTTPGAEGFAQMIAEGVEFDPPERIEPPPDPRPVRPVVPSPAEPSGDPALAGLLHRCGRAVASFVAPGLRLLGRLAARAPGGRQDL